MNEPSKKAEVSPLVAGLIDSLWWSADSETLLENSDTTNDLSKVDLSDKVNHTMESARFSTSGGPFAELRAEAIREALADQRPRGTLESHVVAIKELIAVAGLHRRAGCAALSDVEPAGAAARITQQLRRAGAVVLGSTAMHELACGTTGVNLAFGSPQHPMDSSRICGGSSSGSACAVALGVVDIAVGTDTGGSIRIPSALCGVVGFKPAFGTYSVEGVLPLSPTLDHVGLHAQSVRDVEFVHAALTGECADDRIQRIGVVRAQVDALHGEIRESFDEALDVLSRSSVELCDIELVDSPRVFDVSTAIMLVEAYAVHRRLVLERGNLIGKDVAERLASGKQIPGHVYMAAMSAAMRIRGQAEELFNRVDGIIGPTAGIVAPTFEEAAADPSLPGELVRNTRLANVTGSPAITLPIPRDGLPIGLQVMSTTNSRALGIARWIEELLKDL